jgi:hypothetical protein
MRVSGFTIARNAIKFGYPIKESITSLLPLVDELIVGVGDGDDETWDVVTAIGDPKIEPFRSTWDMSKREGGTLLAEQTNIALRRCSGHWAMYLQSDEVLHESEIGSIRRAMERHLSQATEGLSFRYAHFYGSYGTVQDNWCEWYWREVRAVKTGRNIVSVGDAAGFKIERGGRLQRLIRADSGAHVYHYGWARPPGVMVRKQQNVLQLYEAESTAKAIPAAARITEERPYAMLGNLAHFTGSHPAAMRDVVKGQDWTFEAGIDRQRPRWRRYMSMVMGCPKDTLRIFTSLLFMTWNTHIPSPKLR